MTYDVKKFTDVEFEDIDWRDYPDFCDAYIVRAEYEGKELTEEELEDLQENHCCVFRELLENYIH